MAFRSDTETSSTATTVDPGKPSGTVSSDILVLSIQTTDRTITVTPPTGWTLIRRTDDIIFYSVTVSYWALGSVSSTSFGISGTSAKKVWCGAFSGRDTTTPITASSGNTDVTATSTASSITAVADDDLIGLWHCAAISGSVPSPFTSRSALSEHRVGTADAVSAGATGDASISNTLAESWTAQQIALAVAAGGGSSTDLVIQDAAHGHAADGQTLTSASQLAIADATHGHAADGLGLTLATALAVSDAAHGHAADGPSLTLDAHLVIADAGHAHTTDALGLSTEWLLTVADATHGHAADNLTVSTDNAANLVVADATHAHAAESIGLTLDAFLSIADAAHAHGADALVLNLGSVALVIADSAHAHLADVVPMIAPLGRDDETLPVPHYLQVAAAQLAGLANRGDGPARIAEHFLRRRRGM